MLNILVPFYFCLVWFNGISTIIGYFMPNLFSCIKTVLLQTIQLIKNTLFRSIWPIDRTLSDASTPGLSGSLSYGNKRVFCIPQSSSITKALPSDCLVSYQDTRGGILAPAAEKQSLYSTALVTVLYYGSSLMVSYLSAERLSVYSTILGNRVILCSIVPCWYWCCQWLVCVFLDNAVCDFCVFFVFQPIWMYMLVSALVSFKLNVVWGH